MDAGHTPVVLHQEVVVVVQAAIRADVEFGAVQDGHIGEALPVLVDQGTLLVHLIAGEPVDGKVLAVLGDGDVVQPPRRGGLEHGEQVRAAVTGPGGVNVEVTSDVALGDQAGQSTGGGGRNLAVALTELWGNLA